MICDNGFVFRRGMFGDKPPHRVQSRDKSDVPDFVLVLDDKQVVSAYGNDEHIFLIRSFESGKGYCTKFFELWERYARRKRYTKIVVSKVDNPALEHILEKRGFTLQLNSDEKTYCKRID